MRPALRILIGVSVASLAACDCGSTPPTGGTGGGSTAGGSTAGGSTAGGSTAGGSTAGGSTAGGATAGGATAGGATAGGATAGGATAGGATAGGATAGGATAGGATAGGATAGGATAGGATAGGATAGGATAGGATAGGATAGGATAGGATAGGATAGGATAGGATAGGATAGGATAGGATAGGATAGGATAGGAAGGGPAPTAFRITSLALISPRVAIDVPLSGCQDITQTCPTVFGSCVGDSINTQFANALSPAAGYSLHFVSVFRPLSTTAPMVPMSQHTNAVCSAAPTPDSCGPATAPAVAQTIANNGATACFMPIATDVNTRAGTPAAYTPTVNTVVSPCFITDEMAITIPLGGMPIPLTRARLAGTWQGMPPTQITGGVLVGYLSERDAADLVIPASTPIIGGQRFYSVLQAGNATATASDGGMIADSCNVGGSTAEDDRDPLGTTNGFWVFFNVTAEVVTWTGP